MAHSAKELPLEDTEISLCLIQEPADRCPRPQGIRAEHRLYPGLSRTLATIKQFLNDAKDLVAQQFTPPLH